MRVQRAILLAMAGASALAAADETSTLETPLDAAARSQIEAALRVEEELETALNAVRAGRRETETRLRGRNRRPAEELVDGGRIVNGVSTIAFPGVGALLTGDVPETAGSWCTGTLIGCQTLLTAGHCFDDSRNPNRYHLYFQNAGFVGVAWVSPPHEEYVAPHADLAVVRLSGPVRHLPFVALNQQAVVGGTGGTIIGYGRAGGYEQSYGIKRLGSVKTAKCDRSEGSLLCWDYQGIAMPGMDSNTCNVDSGGPLFVAGDGPGVRLLAGVTSGGTRLDCLTGDHSYDVDVRQFGEWITRQAGSDLGGASCSPDASVGSQNVKVLAGGGRSLRIGEQHDYRFSVPPGSARWSWP